MSGVFFHSETKPKLLVLLFLIRPILLLLHVVSSGSDSLSLAMLSFHLSGEHWLRSRSSTFYSSPQFKLNRPSAFL